MQKIGATATNLISVENQSRSSNTSFNKGAHPVPNRPKSSNSHGRILNVSNTESHDNNSDISEDAQSTHLDIDLTNHETLQIHLTPTLFQNISWANSFDFICTSPVQKDILGIQGCRSNLVWRYFLSLLKQRSSIKQHRERRVAEVKKLFEKLDSLQTEGGKAKR